MKIKTDKNGNPMIESITIDVDEDSLYHYWMPGDLDKTDQGKSSATYCEVLNDNLQKTYPSADVVINLGDTGAIEVIFCDEFTDAWMMADTAPHEKYRDTVIATIKEIEQKTYEDYDSWVVDLCERRGK